MLIYRNNIDIKKVLKRLREVHQYEEPEIDLIPLFMQKVYK